MTRRTNLAIAVETKKHPKHQIDYKVWYLELDESGQVLGVGVKTKEDLIKSLFESYQKSGQSNWRAFLKGADSSCAIEAYDFISKNSQENTHFGNLPTLGEFQQTIDALQMNLQLRSIAC
ncbi:MAG: hypothetical protein JNM93_14230 [Bacteriovoracaceae bacterium]|nr:hypothetical protein [Bacteriovoracaceae bacterium]